MNEEVIYLEQPRGSKVCGQTCLAMAFGKCIEDISIIINTQGGTRNPDIYKCIKYFGFKYKYNRISKKNNIIPEDSIVKIGFKDSTCTHWVYKVEGYFLILLKVF